MPKQRSKRIVIKPVRWTKNEWAQVERCAQVSDMSPGALIRWVVLTGTRVHSEKMFPGLPVYPFLDDVD